jgi:DNA-directed RNA polymerase sigma subunit (sigma70/sigma32)
MSTTVPSVEESFKTQLDTISRQVHVAIEAAEKQSPEQMMTISTPAWMDTLLELIGDVSQSRRMLIRQMRDSGYTLRAVADIIGLSHQRVAQIEAGENNTVKKQTRRR